MGKMLKQTQKEKRVMVSWEKEKPKRWITDPANMNTVC